MFKIGDTVYCINNHYTLNKPLSSLLIDLDLDTPYIIEEFNNMGNNILIKCKDYNNKRITDKLFIGRFISEKEYFISKREEKILLLIKIIKYKNYGKKIIKEEFIE